jgi:hypothetical protein
MSAVMAINITHIIAQLPKAFAAGIDLSQPFFPCRHQRFSQGDQGRRHTAGGPNHLLDLDAQRAREIRNHPVARGQAVAGDGAGVVFSVQPKERGAPIAEIEPPVVLYPAGKFCHTSLIKVHRAGELHGIDVMGFAGKYRCAIYRCVFSAETAEGQRRGICHLSAVRRASARP